MVSILTEKKWILIKLKSPVIEEYSYSTPKH